MVERPRHLWRDAAAVAAVALVVRLVHAHAMQASPFAGMLLGDSRSYMDWAMRLVSGQWWGDRVFYQAPLYPYALGAALKLGLGLDGIRLVQAILGSLACGLVALATARLFDRRAGVIAGLMLAFYPPAIFFDWLIQKSVLDGVLIACLLVLLTKTTTTVTPQRAAVVGVTVGCFALSRENAIVLLPALAVWCAVRASRRTVAILALVAGAALALAPAVIRNSLVGHGLYFTTSQAGPNFFIGNQANASGTYAPLRMGRGDPEVEEADATAIAETTAGRPLRPSEVSRFWLRQSVIWISHHPFAWLRLLGWKLLLALNAQELVDTEDLSTHAGHSFVLRALQPVWHFGVLLPVAVFGLALSWPQRRDVWWLYVTLLMFLASTVAFYVVARYRYPLVPVLVVFAGYGVSAGASWWRTTVPRRRFQMAALVLASGTVANLQLIPVASMYATSEFNLGVGYHRLGDYDGAQAHFARAVELWPAYDNATLNLAALHATRGNHDLALELLTRAAERPGASAQVHMALGRELAQRSRYKEAAAAFARAAAAQPPDPGAKECAEQPVRCQ